MFIISSQKRKVVVFAVDKSVKAGDVPERLLPSGQKVPADGIAALAGFCIV